MRVRSRCVPARPVAVSVRTAVPALLRVARPVPDAVRWSVAAPDPTTGATPLPVPVASSVKTALDCWTACRRPTPDAMSARAADEARRAAFPPMPVADKATVAEETTMARLLPVPVAVRASVAGRAAVAVFFPVPDEDRARVAVPVLLAVFAPVPDAVRVRVAVPDPVTAPFGGSASVVGVVAFGTSVWPPPEWSVRSDAVVRGHDAYRAAVTTGVVLAHSASICVCVSTEDQMRAWDSRMSTNSVAASAAVVPRAPNVSPVGVDPGVTVPLNTPVTPVAVIMYALAVVPVSVYANRYQVPAAIPDAGTDPDAEYSVIPVPVPKAPNVSVVLLPVPLWMRSRSAKFAVLDTKKAQQVNVIPDPGGGTDATSETRLAPLSALSNRMLTATRSR